MGPPLSSYHVPAAPGGRHFRPSCIPQPWRILGFLATNLAIHPFHQRKTSPRLLSQPHQSSPETFIDQRTVFLYSLVFHPLQISSVRASTPRLRRRRAFFVSQCTPWMGELGYGSLISLHFLDTTIIHSKTLLLPTRIDKKFQGLGRLKMVAFILILSYFEIRLISSTRDLPWTLTFPLA